MGNTNFEIRTAQRSDILVIQGIYNDAIINTTALLEYYPYSDVYMDDWFSKKIANDFPVFVACNDREIFGFSSYGHFRERPGYKYTVESTVYLRKEYRGKGLGELLVKALIKHALGRRMHTLIACVESTNIPSLKLHERLGFVTVAEFKEVGVKFDRWINLKFLQLLLPLHT